MQKIYAYRYLIFFWLCLAASVWLTYQSFSSAFEQAMRGTTPNTTWIFITFLLSIALVGLAVYFRIQHDRQQRRYK